MAKLTEMPQEIVELILLSERKDLTAFMRICKSIHTLSEPLLYTEILITWDDCLKPKPSIELLLRTILERPNLASLIKRIRFRNGLDPAARPANHHLSQDVLDLARNSIRLDRFPSSDTWIQGMQEGSVPIIVAFLLSRLHKIETLEIGIKFQSVQLVDMFTHALSDSGASKSISRFRYLKKVKLNPEAYSPRAGILVLDEVLSLFRLPSMQSLSFLVLDGYRPSHRGPCNPMIEVLELRHSQIREETLEHLLSMVPNLKSLNCGLWCETEPIDDHSSFLDCEALSKALKHTRLLEHLVISINFFASSAMEVDWGGAYEKGEHWGIKGSLGSLTDLAHLKSIEVPIVVLLGWVVSSSAPQLADILPRTLRQLLLRNDLNYFYKYEWDQQACLDRLSEYLGRLKTDAVSLDGITVRLRDCPPEDRWDQDGKKKLELLCSEAGVSCTFDPPI